MCRGWSAHTTIESSSCLAGLIARKPTLSQLSLGEVAYDTTKTAETDVPVVAAAVLMCGADVAADRKNQTGIIPSLLRTKPINQRNAHATYQNLL